MRHILIFCQHPVYLQTLQWFDNSSASVRRPIITCQNSHTKDDDDDDYDDDDDDDDDDDEDDDDDDDDDDDCD